MQQKIDFKEEKKKKCSKCGEVKPYSEYYKRKDRKIGIKPECKKCNILQSIKYAKTKEGLCSRIYTDQKKASKQRGHEMPTYTRNELIKWIEEQPNWELLYNNWIKSDYDKMLIPSVDRPDDYKPYTFDNIQLMTWQDNFDKAHKDRVNGINNKANKAIIQFDLDGNIIKEYYSINQAERETNISKGNITECCKGKRRMANNFNWEYKNI